mgnify:CR=1 FL=1
MLPRRSILALVLASPGLLHCGGYCETIAATRTALRTREPTSEPHAALLIPFASVQPLVAEAARSLPPLRLTPPLVALVAGLSIRAAVTDATLTVVAGEPALRVTLAVGPEERSSQQNEPEATKAWLVIDAVVRLRPEVDDGVLHVSVLPEDVADLEPHLAEPSRALLSERLAAWVNDDDREDVEVAERVLSIAADALIAYVGGEGWALIRDDLLADVGELVQLRFALPKLPIERLEVTAAETPRPQLVVAIHTPLPVRAGVATRRGSPSARTTSRRSGASACAKPSRASSLAHLLPSTHLAPSLRAPTRELHHG